MPSKLINKTKHILKRVNEDKIKKKKAYYSVLKNRDVLYG